MKWKLLLFVISVVFTVSYVFQFHRERYDSAVSLVVKGTKNLKQTVGITTVSPASHQLTTAPLPVDLSKATITSSSYNHSKDESDNHNPMILPHTDQKAYNSLRARGCIKAEEIPWSRYGKKIKGVGLTYFTKVDTNFQFLYCSIPKVASSNWKRTMIVLSYDKVTRSKLTRADVNSLKNVHNNPAVKALTKVGGSPVYGPYSKYYKFVFFRHPFTRMVSAWRNKFQIFGGRINKYFYKNYGLEIIRLTRGLAGLRQFLQKREPLISFGEFVVGIRNRIIDRHWMPQTEICMPCEVDYNFVGFFENLDNDTNYILEKIGVIDDIVKPDRISAAATYVSTTNVTIQLFNELSAEDLEALYEFYEKDFIMFGYEKDVNSPTFPYPGVKQTSV